MNALYRQHISRQRSTLRKSMLQKRCALNLTDREKADHLIVERLMQHPVLKKSKKIAGYFSTKGEVNLAHWFIKAWEQGKKCYLPKSVEDGLIFAEYAKNTPMTPNRWGILEPQTTTVILPQNLEVVITPLVAFDQKGNRLGRGKGFYDRTFSFLKKDPTLEKPYLIGVGYNFQETHELSACDWDVPLHSVITENNTC